MQNKQIEQTANITDFGNHKLLSVFFDHKFLLRVNRRCSFVFYMLRDVS